MNVSSLDFAIYETGFYDLRKDYGVLFINPLLRKLYPNFQAHLHDWFNQLAASAASLIWEFAQPLFSEGGRLLGQFFFFFVFSLMWLLNPPEMRGDWRWLDTALKLLRQYFLLKALINIVYCAMVLVLFII